MCSGQIRIVDACWHDLQIQSDQVHVYYWAAEHFADCVYSSEDSHYVLTTIDQHLLLLLLLTCYKVEQG